MTENQFNKLVTFMIAIANAAVTQADEKLTARDQANISEKIMAMHAELKKAFVAGF